MLNFILDKMLFLLLIYFTFYLKSLTKDVYFFLFFYFEMTQVRINCIFIFLFHTSKIEMYLYAQNEFIYIFFINDNKLNNTLILFVSTRYRFVNRLF
jgi:hypothetical protein